MGYCSITYLSTTLPRSVTIGNNNITSPTIEKPNADTIPTTTAYRFINLATQYIDSRLRQLYVCPLKKIKTLETKLTTAAAIGNNFLNVYDAGNFNIDSIARIKDGFNSQIVTVNAIFDNDLNKIGITPNLAFPFIVADAVVYLIEYPDPIPHICAQMAIGLMFDKIFSSEQSPDVSSFGKTQRALAGNSLDDILMGNIRLEGQEHTGRRFHRMSLRDTQATTVEMQHGRDKE